MSTPQATTPPLFSDLAQLASGAWRVKGRWWTLGLKSGLDNQGGWLHVERSTKNNMPIVSMMWTSHRDTHHPEHGAAYSWTLDETGDLVSFSRSAISMHLQWARWGHGTDTQKAHACALLTDLHQAMIVDQRASLRPPRAGVDTTSTSEAAPPKRPGPR